MSKQEKIYFNFPIKMMRGVLKKADKLQFLKNILYFHIQTHANKIVDCINIEETPVERFRRSADFWNVTLNGGERLKQKEGEKLTEKYKREDTFSGISSDMFWEFYNEKKTDFEWECLFAFIALKSILGNKKSCKSNNDLLFARMSGNKSSEDENSYSLIFSRTLRTKIINELEDNWNLKYYSRYNRGFYFGFDISIKDLIFEAEKRRKSTKEKIRKEEKAKALSEVLKKLNPPTP